MAQCAQHTGVEAVATCKRCGRFVCANCVRELSKHRYCSECIQRPDLRLMPSVRAKRCLLLALLAMNGAVVLLPVALVMARAERQAIIRGDAPEAGLPWLAAMGTVYSFTIFLWAIIAMTVMSH